MAKEKVKQIKALRNVQKKKLNILRHTFHRLYNEGYITIVQPPAKRVVLIDNHNYYLSFPHVIFRIRYIKKKSKHYPLELYMAFVDGMKPKKLYFPSLPNIAQHDGTVCIPRPSGAKSAIELVEKWIANFWCTKFNFHLLDCCLNNYNRGILGSFQKWQKKTYENPKWVPNKRNMILSRFPLDEFIKTHYEYEYEYENVYVYDLGTNEHE